jgi:flagellar biosynthesis anti-sigma factor FlgM
MKVGQPNDAQPIDPPSRPSGQTPGTPRAAVPGAIDRVPGETDRVELSWAAKAAGQSSDAFDPVKVAGLQKQIAEGLYPINVEKIAASMISQAAELLETLARPEGAEE